MNKTMLLSQPGITTTEVVAHQGNNICVVKMTDPKDGKLKFFYGILSSKVMEEEQPIAYTELSMPQELSLAGYNLLRINNLCNVIENGCFRLVSDQKYIYLFFSSGYTLYTCRYMAKETKNAAGDPSIVLELAWEVRFKRSCKPDTPYSETDVSDFTDMDGTPFLEPLYTLALGGEGDFEIANGAFSVELVPTIHVEESRWQIFVVNSKTKRLLIYSFVYGADNWLKISLDQYNAGTGYLNPDCIMDLYTTVEYGSEKLLQVVGIPETLLYNKKEPATIKKGGHINLSSSYKIKLMVPLSLESTSDNSVMTSDIDFSIDNKGKLVYPGKKEYETAVRYKVGYTEPIDCSVAFSGGYISLPEKADHVMQSSFIQQLWVYPQNEDTGKHYLIGASKAESDNLLATVWIQFQKRVGFGFSSPDGFFGGISKNDVLRLNVWNNIIVVFSGTQYHLYINGSESEIEVQSISKFPERVKLFDALGIGYNGQTKCDFKGYIDDVRIWKNASSLEDALLYMHKELPDDKVKLNTNLLGYWKFFEGSGETVHNDSDYRGLDGTLVGANWQSNHSPIKTILEPEVYIDKNNFLSLEIAVINPLKCPSYPALAFSDLNSRIHLVNSVDGRLHAYYRGISDYFYKMVYDPLSVKAIYTFPCVCRDKEKHFFDFISRRTGSLANRASLDIKCDGNPYLCTVSLDDGMGYAETWRGVPKQVNYLMQILNGQAFSLSGCSCGKSEGVFYDYSGQKFIAYQAYGTEKEPGQLLFIGNEDPGSHLHKVKCEKTTTGLDVSFVFLDKNKERICLFPSVSTDSSLFLLTLRGFNSNYFYTDEQRKAMAEFDLYQLGASGKIKAFECVLGRIQGVEVKGENMDVSTGSNLFVVYSNQQGDKAHFESVDFGVPGVPKVVHGELKVFGQDGGWVTQSPKQDICIPFGATLQVPVSDAVQIHSFDIHEDLTMETWVRGGTEIVDSTSEYEYQRIFHARPYADASAAAYMLGITPSTCMRMMYRTRIETANCGNLFSSAVYTVVLYVKPDIQTILKKGSTDNRFYTYFINGNNYETLLLNERGELCLNVVGKGKLVFVNTKIKLSEEKWSMITYTRNQAKMVVYLNGKEVGVIQSPVLLEPDPLGKIYLGGNVTPSFFESRICNLSVWSREMMEAEITDRFMKSISVDADGLQLLWEMSNKNTIVQNVAEKNLGKYDAIILNDYMWSYPGLFYRAFGAAGEQAIISRDALIDTEKWNHIAFCRQMEYGIRTGGISHLYAQCPDSNSFGVSTGMTLQGWISPDVSNSTNKQVICSKFSADKENRSFEFGISLKKKNDLYLILSLCDNEGKRTDKEFYTKEAVNLNNTSFVAVSVQISSDTVKVGNEEKLLSTIQVFFYINGKKLQTDSTTLTTGTSISVSTLPFCLGKTRPEGSLVDQSFFSGKIASFALFSTGLDEMSLLKNYVYPTEIFKQKSLVSYWMFREQAGVTAKDGWGNNNLILSQPGMWCVLPEASRTFLIVNGKTIITDKVDVSTFGGYGDTGQVRFGNRLYRGVRSNVFSGEINEFRLWNTARTEMQIAENRYNYLTGREKGLAAYWTFESTAGGYAIDVTGNGNNALLIAAKSGGKPTWKSSDAPQNNELPFIVNAIGGVVDSQSVKLCGSPIIMEYACTEYDYYGIPYSLMKRGAIYPEINRGLVMSAGFKIGTLKRVYMGQMQSDPTIVGFFEGTPPIPSENLTRPYYQDPASSDYFAYDDCSSVLLTEDKGLEVSLSSSKEKAEKFTISTDNYLLTYLEFAYNHGAFFKEKTFSNEFRIGGHYDEDLEDDTKGDSRTSVTRLNSTVTNQLFNRGDWEKPDSEGNYLIRNKRRYIPRNEGLALVKSSTVDVFVLLLEETDAMVGMEYELNRDIPEDMNYINFPIDPLYVKNGTLDGKVGIQNDESYPGADLERGSYFKPIESYSLKKQIERENHKLAANYAQFSVSKPSDLEINDTITNQFAQIAYYDQVKELFKRDIVNEYIWTAAGGFYNQSDGYVNSIQESYFGNFGKGHDDTGGFADEFLCCFGFKIENTFTRGHHWTMHIEKGKSAESSIRLEISAAPDPHLGSLTMQEDQTFTYSSNPELGKVDSYRFNTFYLASSKENYNTLFSTVIDKKWLNSNDPKAKLLQQVQNKAEGSAYRIFYRVTYVSRVIPEYQNFPLESNSPKISKPINIPANNLLLAMVDNYCNGDIEKLAEAINNVIKKNLCINIPGWSTFLAAADVYNSPEYITLIQLMDDTVDYMQSYYASKS